MLSASRSSQTTLWFESGGFGPGVGGGGASSKQSACHCVIVGAGRVTDTSRDSVAVVPFVPPSPYLTPNSEAPADTHSLKLCNPAEPAQVLGELDVLARL